MRPRPQPAAPTPEVDRPLEALLTRLRPHITRILSENEIPDADAEDLLQETLYALVFKWGTVRKPEAWLLATLRNRCQIYRRAAAESLLEAVDTRSLEALAGPQAPPQETADLRHDLTVAFSRLPERYRDVLRLRYGLGCESAEVAARLGYESEGIRRLT
ncbi:MAG TPA: sigma-70 family RNA polymerase sigma factor, partial [Thermoanaerobaculia bacterium]|nr:sigma-70 family RNA polymerase sigma factor [Thermoanaerobaculia bacterium]